MMKRRSMAEQMFKDMMKTIREKQEELEKALAVYTAAEPEKPTMDVIDTDEKIVVKTDLPGVKKEDIKIDLTEDSLAIEAKFEEESEVKEADYVRKERRYGEAKRSMILPAKVKTDEATAKFEDGVLTIELPKIEKKETIKVDIK
jgi:HSP20 family protein